MHGERASLRGDVRPVLLDDRVGPEPHLPHEPLGFSFMRRRSWHAGPEGELGFDVAQCDVPVERRLVARAASERQNAKDGEKSHGGCTGRVKSEGELS